MEMYGLHLRQEPSKNAYWYWRMLIQWEVLDISLGFTNHLGALVPASPVLSDGTVKRVSWPINWCSYIIATSRRGSQMSDARFSGLDLKLERAGFIYTSFVLMLFKRKIIFQEATAVCLPHSYEVKYSMLSKLSATKRFCCTSARWIERSTFLRH